MSQNNAEPKSDNLADQSNHSETLPLTSLPPSEKLPLADYEPYAYGKKHNPTVFWGPIFHLLKYIIGTGILTIPYIFQEVGYVAAIFGTLFVGSLYIHILHIFLDVEYQLCKKLKTPSLTYVSLVQHTFQYGPRFTRGLTPIAKFMVYFHYLFNKSIMNAVYVITVSSNFKIIIDHYYETNTSLVIIMTVLLMPLISLSFIRHLKFLVPLSMLTNLFNLLNFALILFIPTNYKASSAGTKAINDISKFPNFCVTILGALECTGLCLPMKSDMKNPKRFTSFFGVINIALSTAIILYGTFGVLGMLKYGDRLKANILLNLPPEHLASLIILSIQSLAVCISIILKVYIGFDTVWKNLFSDKEVKHHLVMEYGLRIALCILPYSMALAFPDFRVMITLAFAMGIIVDESMAPILHAVLLVKQKPKSTQTYLILLKDIAIILIFLYILIATLMDVTCVKTGIGVDPAHNTQTPISMVMKPCDATTNEEILEKASLKNRYDPHDYGNEHHPTAFWGSVCHFFKSIVGTGILALPHAFETVGYAIAIPGTLLVGFLYSHILHLLLDVEYELCSILKTPRLTYARVLQHAFELGPKPMRKLASAAKFFLYFNYVVNGSMYNAVYLVMIAGNLKKICLYYYKVDHKMSVILSVIIVPLLILGLIRRLKFLVPLSMLTTACNFVNIFLILYLSWNRGNVEDVKPINDLYEFPPFFGIVLGALSSTGIVIPLKNDMKNPRSFSALFGVLNIALTGATILYVTFGFLGYLKYGSQIEPNILANLPPDNNLTLLVLVLYSLAICVSYTLFVYVAFDTIHSNLPVSQIKHRRVVVEYAIRIGLTILPYFIAVAVPNFRILVSIGGVISILIDVGLLPFIHMLLLWAKKSAGKNTLHTATIFLKDLLLILIAIFLFSCGVINVIEKLKRFFA